MCPIQLDRKKTLIPLLDAISKKAVHRPWSAADTIESQVTATDLIEEHIRAAMLQNLSNGNNKKEYMVDLGTGSKIYTRIYRVNL